MTASRKRILVVDDEAGFADLVKTSLEALGSYDVRVENQAGRVLAAVRDYRPDLILLDLALPGLDGGTLAVSLGSDRELKAIPIVFMTAMVANRKPDGGERNIAGHPLLIKPMRFAELASCIETTLSRKSPRLE